MAIQFLNNVNADSGVLYVDAVDDKVGIGTTSPTAKLDVDGEISIGGDQTADQARLTFRASDESKRFTIESDLDSSTSNDLLGFRGTTVDNILVLKGDGKVGIGTSSPQEKLDISAGSIRLDDNQRISWSTNDSNIGRVRITGNESNDFISFATDNSERMRLTNTGLGIGTTSPGAKLEVNGNSRFVGSMQFYQGTTSNQYLNIFQSSSNTYINTGTSGETIYFGAPAVNTTNINVQGTVDADNFNINGAQGSDGQVLTSTGSGVAWEDVSGGLPTTGGTMTGDLKFNDNVYCRFGNATNGDLVIGHTNFGSPYNVISSPDGTTPLEIRASNLILESANGETYIDCNFNSSVDLYYNNSKKFETTNTGVSTTGNSIITGDVGVGTTSPDGFLHIDGMTSSKAAIVVEAAGSGDNVIMEMQNNAAAKRMTLQYDNSNINFNITDRNDDPIITFRESGNIGIGLETPSSALEMSGTLDNTSSKLLRLTRDNQGSGPAKAVGFYSNNGERGSITVSNFATAYNTSSDYRLKENVVPIEDSVNRLMSLKPCRFNFISEEQVVDGFLAHETQDIVPEAISGEKDQIDEDGNEVYQGIDQAKLVPLLTAALQEAIKRIEILEQKNK